MNGYRIQLFRHGITQGNIDGRYIGITDLPLCDKGISELDEKTEKFFYPQPDRIYTSPLKRCVGTAAVLYPERSARLVTELREMNFGDFENKKAVELMNREDYKQFLKGGLDNPPPNGESLRKVVERSFEGIDFIIEDMMKNGYRTASVITHGGIIMNLLSCFGLPKKNPLEFNCDFGEGFEIFVTAQLWQTAHAFEIMGRIPYSREDPDSSEIYNEED